MLQGVLGDQTPRVRPLRPQCGFSPAISSTLFEVDSNYIAVIQNSSLHSRSRKSLWTRGSANGGVRPLRVMDSEKYLRRSLPDHRVHSEGRRLPKLNGRELGRLQLG
jgi:hypothetical protein